MELCHRESQQNFEEVHSRLKRGDIVGVKGKPGEMMWWHVLVCDVVSYVLMILCSEDQEGRAKHSAFRDNPSLPLPSHAATPSFWSQGQRDSFQAALPWPDLEPECYTKVCHQVWVFVYYQVVCACVDYQVLHKSPSPGVRCECV